MSSAVSMLHCSVMIISMLPGGLSVQWFATYCCGEFLRGLACELAATDRHPCQVRCRRHSRNQANEIATSAFCTCCRFWIRLGNTAKPETHLLVARSTVVFVNWHTTLLLAV